MWTDRKHWPCQNRIPDHDGRDNGAEMDSNNKTDQQVRVPEFRALVAEIRQLKNQMVAAAGGAGASYASDDGYSDDYYSEGDVPDSGGGDVSNGLLTNPGLD